MPTAAVVLSCAVQLMALISHWYCLTAWQCLDDVFLLLRFVFSCFFFILHFFFIPMGVECFYSIIKSKFMFSFDEIRRNCDNSNDSGWEKSEKYVHSQWLFSGIIICQWLRSCKKKNGCTWLLCWWQLCVCVFVRSKSQSNSNEAKTHTRARISWRF